MIVRRSIEATNASLRAFAMGRKWRTLLADPPWRFNNAGGRVGPETKRLFKYPTMAIDDIAALAVGDLADAPAHLYLWVPNALLPDGIRVLEAWGFAFMSNLVWKKTTMEGELHRGGVGWYFRNATELVLFGVRGKSPRTLPPARSQPNLIEAPRGAHSEKPDEFYDLIERCSPGPYLELFARRPRSGWTQWGNEMDQTNDEWDPGALLREYGETCERRGLLWSELTALDNRLSALSSRLLGRLQPPAPPPAPPSVGAPPPPRAGKAVGWAHADDLAMAAEPKSKPKPDGRRRGRPPAAETTKVVGLLHGAPDGMTKEQMQTATGFQEPAVRHALAAAVRAGRVVHGANGLYTLVEHE